ncbi:MAG: ABC transporter permease, partial [Mameliella sp.]|nr:ABC transporter permease [Mameliella sp.]
MKSFLGQRAIASAISLVALIVLVFFLSRLTGDPTTLYLPVDASLESREQFRELHGLNDPLIVQFGRYVGDLVRLDFGESIRRSEPALDAVLRAFVWTLQLAVITMALVTAAAIVLGSLAAFKVGGLFDRIATFFSLIGASAPDFWIAIVAIVIFSVNLGWVPTSGTGSVWHWILPISVLFIRPFGLILQIVRGSMITALSSAYVKTARAKGVRNRPIIFVHALRNAMLPVITVIGDQAAALLNGAVVVETVL